ncbi:MAG TPA: homoserine dehydrogenase [Actinomycetota bacterium]|nr:homoserine dehydrogenase [Actinomycetota bacterium]
MGVTRTLGVGMLGCGTVGASVARLLHDGAPSIARRTGATLEVRRVGVRDPGRDRSVPLPPDAFTADLRSVVADPSVDVVLELLGGIEPARALIRAAFDAGKHVVTANKELVATHGRELLEAAAAAGVALRFEAAVGGGIPLVHPLRESLAGDRITRVIGIVNGTTNYVLTRMTEEGLSFDDALTEAQALGFAERDPTDDVEGHDAAAKCAILAALAFDVAIAAPDVYREGITGVRPEDIEFAARLDHVVKLLAVAELADGEVAARVHPAMLPREHPLASVRDSFNAVFVEGEHAGQLMFFGRGAGGAPTATAVVGDLIDVARDIARGARGPAVVPVADRPIRPIEAMQGQYYVCLHVADRPGVLAQVAGAFGSNDVSIKSVWQEGTGEEALLVLITHRANEGDLRRTMDDLRGLDAVTEVRSVMRVEGGE